jgi:peptide/nickel transport system substrate-binding protein
MPEPTGRTLRALIAGLVAAAALAAWTTAAPAQAPRTPAPSAITIATVEWIEQFDPGVLASGPGMNYKGAMFDNVIGAGPNGTLSKTTGVVEDWTVSADATQVVLKLRKGVKWHDGVEATAEDLAFTLTRFGADDGTASARPTARKVASLETTDKYTVKVTLKEPDSVFVYGLSPLEGDMLFLRKDAYKKTDKGWELGNAEAPVGTGPYRFARRKLGEFVEYEAFDDYWDRGRRAAFRTLRIVRIVDASTRLSALRTGEVAVAPLNPEQLDAARGAGLKLMGPKVAAIPLLMFFGSYDPAFLTHKLEFRKALMLGYDKKAIVAKIYPPAVGTLATGAAPFSPVSLGWDASLPAQAYNPQEAKRLLQAAGYDKRPVKIWSYPFGTAPELPLILEAISGYWQGLGLNVELTPIDFPAFRPRLFAQPQPWEKSYAAHVGFLVPLPRPSTLNNLGTFMISQKAGGVAAGYWNSEKIDRIRSELGKIGDLKQLDRRLRDLHKELYGEHWADPIVFRHLVFGVSPKICGWTTPDAMDVPTTYATLRPCAP